jgi:hypothetical protein
VNPILHKLFFSKILDLPEKFLPGGGRVGMGRVENRLSVG